MTWSPATTSDELGIVARLDVDELGIGGASHVGEERAAGRVVDTLGREDRVQGKNHAEARERVDGSQHALLVDDRIDLDVGQVGDGPCLERGHHGLGHQGAVAPKLEVVDQAIFECRIGVFDRPGRVDAVDPPHERHGDLAARRTPPRLPVPRSG